MKRGLVTIMVVIASVALTAGIVKAASEHNVTSTLGGVSGDIFDLDGTIKVDSLRVGQQSIGGVTFFNGTIVNSTTDSTGADNPVTFGDNVRIDGRIYRGATAGTSDTMPFIVNDNMEVAGNLTINGGLTLGSSQTLTMGATSILDVSNATIAGLSSDDLSDSGVLTKTDTAATLTADWVNTANPWSAAEVADIIRRVEISIGDLYTDANDAPDPVESASSPTIIYTANQGLAVIWSGGEQGINSDIGGQFTVPDDYSSGGVLKAVVDTSGDIVSAVKLDYTFAISQTGDNAAWDSDMDNEDPVDVPDNAGVPDVVTLTPTDQTDITAGSVIYFDIYPDSFGAGEPNLELYALWFEYTAVQ